VALVLTDQGRVGAGPAIGSGVARVEGALLTATDSDYTLRVSQVTDIRGEVTRWSGEVVTLRRSWIGTAYQRHLSRARTYLLAGTVTAGLVAFAASRGLIFGGGPVIEPAPGGGGGGQQ
jgi:hypothetical protein